jgi:5-methylcytosine-specific restriction protein A
MFLRSHPLCVDPFGLHANSGQVVAATEVDHIRPKSNGGTDEWDNLQGLCKSCHSRKTALEQRNMGQTTQVTIVSGPPGSGKTTYVKSRARWGDLIVDMDALYIALSGLPWYEKPDALLPFVAEARDAVINRLYRESHVRKAWLVTSESSGSKLGQLSRRLGAEVVVLEVPANECLRRIANDERRADKAELWQPIVERWWRNYSPPDRYVKGS